MAQYPPRLDADTQHMLDLLTTARTLVELRYCNTNYPAMTTALQIILATATAGAQNLLGSDNGPRVREILKIARNEVVAHE